MSRETKNTLLLQGSILAAAGIFTKLIGFLYRIPMANLLGNQGNGVYSVAYGIYTITLTLSSMSLPTAVSKVVSARLAREEGRNASRVLAMALLFALVMGTFSFSLLYFGADMLEELYSTAGLHRPLQVLAPTSFLFAFLGVMRGYTQGSGDMVPTAVSQIVDQCCHAIMSIVAAWALLQMYGETAQAASWGAMGGTLGTLAGAVASFLLMTVILLRRLPEIRLRARRDRTGQEESWGLIARALILTILPIVFSQTIYQISYTLDDLLFSRFMNAAGTAENAITSIQGVFNTQYNQMVNLPVSIATAMAMTLMPSIVASYVTVSYTHLIVLGKFLAGLPEIGHAHFLAVELVLFNDGALNGHAVVVPAGDIGCVIAPHGIAAGDKILDGFVQRVAHMQRAVGEGGAVMQGKTRLAFVLFQKGLVNVNLFPLCKHFRLALGQALSLIHI